MKFTAKAKNSSTSGSEGWGMGFFLVFFPEEDTTSIRNKPNLSSSSLPSPSPSSAKFTTINTLLRRTNSTHILTTAQSTISICALLIFITLLLFTLSTFEPTTTPPISRFTSRRHLSSNTLPALKKSPPWPFKILTPTTTTPHFHTLPPPHALQKMGTLINRGTKAMNDLIVCHLTESLTTQDLRVFLKLLHRSTLTSKSDLIFILPNSPPPSFNSAIREETKSFLKLIHQYKEVNELNTTNPKSPPSFDLTQFLKSNKKEKEWGEPIWGRGIQQPTKSTESTRLSFGSVVSFELDELDPENSLSGFLNEIPMSLRRWACYPMLLGRIRRNFKHIILVDVKDTIIFNDPLGRVRSQSPESVYLTHCGSTQSGSSKHSKKNSDKNQSGHKPVNPGVIMGGVRGVRRLANAVLTEIARATIQHKRKNSVTESGILSQLAGNGFLLKNVDLVVSTESIPEVSWVNSGTGTGTGLSVANLTVVRRGNSNSVDVNGVIMKHLCSFPLDSSVYREC